MLLKKLLMFFVFVLVLVSTLPVKAQTAWVDSGSVNLSVPGYKIVTYKGIIHEGDSLLSPGIAIRNYEPIFSVIKYMTKADSAKITITRESNWFSTQWTKAKTIWSASTTLTQEATVDTVRYDPDGLRLKFKGSTGAGGNGDSTVVNVKLVFKRE